MIENINLFDFTLTGDDLQEIRLLDTGRNVTGWPSDALKYNPEIGSSNYQANKNMKNPQSKSRLRICFFTVQEQESPQVALEVKTYQVNRVHG